MSTRSRIGYVERNGWVVSSYCHWDGYPSNNGDILKHEYTALGKVQRLVWLGSISSLKKWVRTSRPHSFDRPRENITVAYVRDRGESREHCAPRIDADAAAFMRSDVEEWGYLFKDGKWFIVDGHEDVANRRLVELTDAIVEADGIV